MCVVIDINVLALVLNPYSGDHNFQPMREWIEAGDGFLVYGGTKYKKELMKTPRYLRLIRLMKDAGKAAAIRDSAVDSNESVIRRKLGQSSHNDHHIVALLGAAHCPLLCSKDRSSFSLIKNWKLYPPGAPRVKIYCSIRNKNLLKRSSKASLRNVE